VAVVLVGLDKHRMTQMVPLVMQEVNRHLELLLLLMEVQAVALVFLQ
jgi:aspartate-semialdehyde dehydrogenase